MFTFSGAYFSAKQPSGCYRVMSLATSRELCSRDAAVRIAASPFVMGQERETRAESLADYIFSFSTNCSIINSGKDAASGVFAFFSGFSVNA